MRHVQHKLFGTFPSFSIILVYRKDTRKETQDRTGSSRISLARRFYFNPTSFVVSVNLEMILYTLNTAGFDF